MFEQKKYRGVMCDTLKNNAKFEEKMTYALKNDMTNFDSTLKGLKIFILMGSF